MTKISDTVAIRNELRSTCSTIVSKLLFDFVGADQLNSCTEQQLLAHIKSVAVKGVHKEVHCQTFHSLHQSPGESITCFLARLRAQAALCEFCITCSFETCTTSVSYAEDMIAGQMIVGLANVDHQAKILAEAMTLITFKDKYDRLASLETTDQSTSHLHMAPPRPMPPPMPSESAAQKSQYTRQKWPQRENKTPTPCKGCGETTHPAFNSTCHNCGIRGHLERVCRQPKAADKHQESTSKAMQSDPATVTDSYIFWAQLSSPPSKSA